MSKRILFIVAWASAPIFSAGGLQQQHENACDHEAVKGKIKEASEIYNIISEAEPLNEKKKSTKKLLCLLYGTLWLDNLNVKFSG